MMSHFIKLFFLTSVSCISLYSKADIKPEQLKLTLTIEQAKYAQTDVIQFNLTFTNLDHQRHAVLLPGYQHCGKKMIYFSFYTVKDNFYTEVARESRAINMDSIYYSQVLYKYLNSHESTTVPIFFGDSINFKAHIEAHHLLPNLPSGEYQVLAWYNPWEQEMAAHAFNKISDFKEPAMLDTTKINLHETGGQSNYITLKLENENTEKNIWQPTTFCPSNCRLCKMIEHENWARVEEIIDDQTFYNGKHDKQYADSNWLQPHRNIAWVGPMPDAILSSLPSYTSRHIIFRNTKGYYYYQLRWQIGIIYPLRSRISRWIFRRKNPIKTEELDYFKLIGFEKY